MWLGSPERLRAAPAPDEDAPEDVEPQGEVDAAEVPPPELEPPEPEVETPPLPGRVDPPGDIAQPTAEPSASEADATGPELDPSRRDDAPPGPPRLEPDIRPGTSEEVDLVDPLGPIDAALAALEDAGFEVTGRRRFSSALQGDVLTAELRGTEVGLMRYVLSKVADDGYQILLEPVAQDTFEFVAIRARPGQPRGVAIVDVQKIELTGAFRKGEDASTLRKIADVPPGGVINIGHGDALRAIGYDLDFRAGGDGVLSVRVEAARSIRRVRIRGNIPLPEREVRLVLGPESRPGSIAKGECISRRKLRKDPPASMCAPDDLTCRQWERDQIERIERFLFDQGYLRGTATLATVCGRDRDEADLFVSLDKGKPFRVEDIRISGNLGTREHDWVRRVARPTLGPLLPFPTRITRKHIEKAKERIEMEYARPRSTFRSGARRELQLPYPGVQVETNFDDLTREDVPQGTNEMRLIVDVQLGNGVKTAFLGNERITNSRLADQLQLFQRREPATATAVAREAANLRNYYQTRGFLLAEVEGRFQDFGALKQMTFVIDEGPRVSIRDIELERPEGVPPAVWRGIVRNYRREREVATRGRFVDAQARDDLATLLSSLAAEGYLCAQARMRVAFFPEGFARTGAYAILDLGSEVDSATEPSWLERQLDPAGLAAVRKRRRAGLYVKIDIDAGPRVLTSGREVVQHLEIPIPPSREVANLPTTARGSWGAPRMLRDGPLRRRGDERAGGIPLSLTLDRDAQREIVRNYRAEGYPLADAELRWVYTDSRGTLHTVAQAERLTDAEVGLCRDHAQDLVATVDTRVSVYEGRRATFGTTLLRGNFKTRDWVLRREIRWEEGEPYRQGKVARTRSNIEGIGVAESVTIRELPTNCQLSDDPEQPCTVNAVISIREAKDRAMDVAWGVGGATLDPLYVFVRPTFPNMFGTAWDLQLDAHFGANLPGLREVLCDGEDCYERSGRASLIRRRIFASPLTFEISGQFQRRVTPARGQIDSALGQVRLTWPISDAWQVYVGYLIQAANISKRVAKPVLPDDTGCGSNRDGACRVPDRSEAIVPDLTGGLQTGVTYSKVDNAFNPEDGFIATGDLLLASPWLGGQDWWFRYEFSWQHFIPIPRTNNRLNFRYLLTYGHAVPMPSAPGAQTRSIPEVWRYFGGGTADLGIRGIEPQTMLVDIEEIPVGTGAVRLRPTAQGGHIRALGTVALQVVSVRDLLGGSLAHSVFLDVGVLTQRWRHVVPLRDIRRSVGINFIKWDIRIVTVSLGYAVLVPNSIIPGNVRPTDDRNGRFVFDVGATF